MRTHFIFLIILFVLGTILVFIKTLWASILMTFWYIAVGFWFGYAGAGGFDK